MGMYSTESCCPTLRGRALTPLEQVAKQRMHDATDANDIHIAAADFCSGLICNHYDGADDVFQLALKSVLVSPPGALGHFPPIALNLNTNWT